MTTTTRDPQFDSLLPKTMHTRRGFLVTSLGAGFALAVQPSFAQSPVKTDSEGLTAGEIKVPVLGLYGGADQGIPLDDVESMREALKKAGNKSEIVVYPDTPHAFHADYRPTYRKEAAEDGWKRLLEWFKAHGMAAPAGGPKPYA